MTLNRKRKNVWIATIREVLNTPPRTTTDGNGKDNNSRKLDDGNDGFSHLEGSAAGDLISQVAAVRMGSEMLPLLYPPLAHGCFSRPAFALCVVVVPVDVGDRRCFRSFCGREEDVARRLKYSG